MKIFNETRYSSNNDLDKIFEVDTETIFKKRNSINFYYTWTKNLF